MVNTIQSIRKRWRFLSFTVVVIHCCFQEVFPFTTCNRAVCSMKNPIEIKPKTEKKTSEILYNVPWFLVIFSCWNCCEQNLELKNYTAKVAIVNFGYEIYEKLIEITIICLTMRKIHHKLKHLSLCSDIIESKNLVDASFHTIKINVLLLFCPFEWYIYISNSPIEYIEYDTDTGAHYYHHCVSVNVFKPITFIYGIATNDDCSVQSIWT